jgi:predicted amidohydrolase
MKIAVCQFAPSWENIEESIDRIDTLAGTIQRETDLIIFPEMTLTGFTMKSEEFAEEPDGICTKYFIGLSRKLRINIMAGIIENDGGKIYNSAVHFDRSGIITARYRKIHPFSMAGEEKYFDAGSETVGTKIDGIKTGLSVCYDLRFPELYRLYSKDGARLLINIANWPVTRIFHWEQLLKARAIENLSCVIGVNRVGSDPFNEYNGTSLVFDAMGNEIMKCGNDEGIFYAELDFTEVDNTRARLNFLDDIKLL